MQRLRLALLLIHAAIAVFAVIGCIVAGLNYGLNYPLLKTDEPIEKPVLEPEDDDLGQIDYKKRHENYAKRHEYMSKMNIRASYNNDTRVWTMVPFLATAVVTGIAAVLARTNVAVYRTTAVLNADLALWLLSLSFMISNYSVRTYRIDVSLRKYWAAGSKAVLAFNSVMLVLLAAAVVLCGVHLRLSKVHWPRCNALNIFTLNSLLTVASVVMNSIMLPLMMEEFSRGFMQVGGNGTEASCVSSYYCPYTRLPATLYFASMATLCVSLVLAIEALLSLVWGVRHRNLAITASVVLGAANFVVGTLLSPVGVYSLLDGKVASMSFLSLVVAVMNLFHAWALWCSPKFICSPPDILKILCGRNKTTLANSGLDEPVPEEEDASPPACHSTDAASPSSTAENSDEVVAGATDTDRSSVVDRSRCLLTNTFLLILSLSLLLFLGSLLEVKSYSSSGQQQRHAVWYELLLLMVLTAVAAKALVSIVTVLSAGTPSRKTPMQSVLEVALEGVLLLPAVIGMLVNTPHTDAVVTSVLVILIVLIKVLELPKASPVHKFLKMFMVSRGPDCVLLTSPAEGYAEPLDPCGGDTSTTDSPTSDDAPAAASADIRPATPT